MRHPEERRGAGHMLALDGGMPIPATLSLRALRRTAIAIILGTVALACAGAMRAGHGGTVSSVTAASH